MVSSASEARVRPYHHGNLQEAAVEAAVALVRRDGGAHFTLREIAAAIGVSHGALYRHFADRDALLAAVAARGLLALHAAQREALGAAGPHPADQLKAICRAHLAFALERSAEYRVMFDAFELDVEGADASLQRASGPALKTLLDTMEAWRREVGLAGVTVPEAAAVLWSAVHGLIMLRLAGQIGKLIEGPALDGLLALTVDTVLAGLRAQASGQGPEGDTT